MRVDIALGGEGDEDAASWLYVGLERRASWSRLIDPHEPLTLQELYAWSPEGDLNHPGEVPLASDTTLTELLATIDGELGAKARVTDVRMLLRTPPPVVFTAHDERDLRLEASSDEHLAGRLARMTEVDAATWARLFSTLRWDALTQKHLRVTELSGAASTAEVKVYASRDALLLDDPIEALSLELRAD